MRLAWFHCFSGIAGDMALGSLLDAGAPLDEVTGLLERLPVGGWALEAEPVMRNGIAATRAVVLAEEGVVVRTAAHVVGLVEEARLPERVRRRALDIFWSLARAEGSLHRRPPESVHFHEVGGLDAIVDVVGTCAALEILGVDEVHASPVANGIGMTRAAHGLLPVPAPAVVELLRGIPTYAVDIPLELTTPTGAAILAGTATGFGPLPTMTVEAAGFGAGSAELGDRPNLTQVVIGSAAAELAEGQPVIELTVNVDDATGETLAHAVAALLESGAHDAWVTPTMGKKGRPAYTVSALADPSLAGQVARVLAGETGSLGVRATRRERWPLAREEDQVEVEGLPVRVKISPGRVKVEYADASRVARRTGLPLREVVSLAEEAARRRPRSPSPPNFAARSYDPDPGHGHRHGYGHDHDRDHGYGYGHDHGHGHDHGTLDVDPDSDPDGPATA